MRTGNPFQMDPTWRKATDNLARIIGGNPEQEAAMEASLTSARSTQQEDRFKRDNRQHMGEAADAFGDQNYTAGMQEMMRTGRTDIIEQAPELQLGAEGAFQAENMGAGDRQGRMMALQGGAGLQPDADTAFTPDAQAAISGRNAQEDQEQARVEEWAGARADAANPTTMEGALTEQYRSGDVSAGDVFAKMQSGQMTPDEIVGLDMQRGGTGLEEGVRLTNPLSSDERIADQARTLEDVSRLRYGHEGGGPGGSGGSSPSETLDMIDDSQGVTPAFQDATSNVFREMGVPTNDDGGLELNDQMGRVYSDVVDRAYDNAVRDTEQNGRPTGTSEEYVRRAVEDMDMSFDDGYEPGTIASVFGYEPQEPSLRTGSRDSGGGDGGGQMQSRPQASSGQSGPQAGAVEDGYRFLGGDPGNPENWEEAGGGGQEPSPRRPGAGGWRGTTLQVPDA